MQTGEEIGVSLKSRWQSWRKTKCFPPFFLFLFHFPLPTKGVFRGNKSVVTVDTYFTRETLFSKPNDESNK
jgi:hypothetical protein